MAMNTKLLKGFPLLKFFFEWEIKTSFDVKLETMSKINLILFLSYIVWNGHVTWKRVWIWQRYLMRFWQQVCGKNQRPKIYSSHDEDGLLQYLEKIFFDTSSKQTLSPSRKSHWRRWLIWFFLIIYWFHFPH